MMKKSLLQLRTIRRLLPLLVLAACSGSPKDDGKLPTPLYPQPKTIEANPEGGYEFNTVTGERIQPLVNSYGDTVKTGVPIPAKGKKIHPDSVAKPKVVNIPSRLTIKNAHPNRHTIPKNLPTFKVDHSKLNTVPFGEGNQDFVLLSTTGDTIPTGVPIPAKGKIVPAIHPEPTKALPPAFKDAAMADIRFLDVDQGMNASYVSSVLEDKRGNVWFGTNGGGVSKYDGETFTHYTEKEGLSSNYVWAIVEDKNGNLWFGTYGGGVNKYDGETFTHYTTKEGLNHNRVHSIIEDTNGNLWFGTAGGGVSKLELSGVDGSDRETFTHYTTKEGLSSNFVWAVLEDKNGDIWIGTFEGGVNKLVLGSGKGNDGESFIHFTKRDGLSDDRISSIAEDKNGNLWFGTERGGVTRYDGKAFTHFTEKEGLSNNRVLTVFEDQRGILWFGTFEGGVSRLDGETFTHFTEKEGVSSNLITSILEDSGGNLWFTSFGGGVNRYDRESFLHFTEKEGLSNKVVTSIFEDRNGYLWFGTFGGGVSRYDGKTFTHFSEKEGLADTRVFSIVEDQSGNMWFGTFEGGVSRYDGKTFTNFTQKEGLTANNAPSIREDDSGNLWFATIGGVTRYDGTSFTHFTEKEGMSKNIVFSIFEDSSGNLWFGTEDGGVSRFDGENFTHFTEKEGLSINRIVSIVEDKNGNLWFGTEGGGLSKFDGETFTHINETEGLSHNKAWAVVEDNSGNLFIGTDKGLTKISMENAESGEITYSMHVFTQQDGLKAADFNFNAIIIDNKNRAWLGSGKSLVMFDLNTFKTSSIIPNPQLKQLDIDGQFIDFRTNSETSHSERSFTGVQKFENYPIDLQLPYHENHLTFHFTAIDWAAPHKIRYSYRLLGLDDSWSTASKEAKADYRNLPHGHFTLQIRAIGESGQWSDPFEYTFVINPPWWHTWWAYVLYALIFLASLRQFSMWRERKLRLEKEQLQEKVEERTQQLAERNQSLTTANEEIQQQRDEVVKARDSLEKTLEHLKSTQTQLVHAEKMASLGELTAGIAHEIQNPLNFVNNFSEVNGELIDEQLEEIEKGDLEEIKELANLLKENSSKINHHGKRADAIVKGMLAHSRTGQGQKEPTNINQLADEFLRLSYHGLRAKDKSFNADFKTDFDPELPKVNVISQDIGRVLLNLINNAFQACITVEKPLVQVFTKRTESGIEITVSDNGPGIPDNIKDKIFQPFFTTKKGTEGTGLGLSITNDIIKAHGGELTITSIPNEKTVFCIKLPQ